MYFSTLRLLIIASALSTTLALPHPSKSEDSERKGSQNPQLLQGKERATDGWGLTAKLPDPAPPVLPAPAPPVQTLALPGPSKRGKRPHGKEHITTDRPEPESDSPAKVPTQLIPYEGPPPTRDSEFIPYARRRSSDIAWMPEATQQVKDLALDLERERRVIRFNENLVSSKFPTVANARSAIIL
jgi:hypothetical protein